jgi:hypothetical protein
MADQIQSNRFICEGGLDTTKNYLNLSANKPGSATRLINYEPGLAGGYRRINGYQYYDTTYPEPGVGLAQGKILGIFIFDNSVTHLTEIYAARRNVASPTEYKIYRYDGSFVGWTLVATGLTHLYSSGAYTVDKIRYDVGNNGSGNYLAFVDGVNNACIFDGTTWSFIDSADSGAAMATAGGDQAINAPTLVTFFKDTLFIACDEMNGYNGIAVYSAPGTYYKFTAASGAGQLTTGVEIVDIKPFRDKLYIFGYNKIKSASADVTAGFLMTDVTGNMGLIARDAVVEIGGDLIFLGPDGFRPVQGTDKIGDVQLETISKPIHNLVVSRTYGLSDLNVNSVVIRSKSQFRMFFGDDSTDVIASRGILGALRTGDQQMSWEFGETLGFRTSVVTSRYIGGTEYVIHGDFDGKVYRQELAGSLNGTDMVAIYSTPYIDMGDTQVRKLLKTVNTFIIGEGANISVQLGVDFDWGNPDVPNPSTYTIDVTAIAPTYDSTALYDTGEVYGGFLYPVLVQNVEGSFFSVRLTYTTSGTEDPYSVLGFIVEYETEGRR